MPDLQPGGRRKVEWSAAPEAPAVHTGADHCPVRQGPDGVWQVRGYEAARAVLRSTDTVQAGLGIETMEKLPAAFRRPVLYRDGPEHREHRRQTARFFTPRRVNEHYRSIMERVAEAQLATLRAAGEADLSHLGFRLAIEVATAVIGLTESRPGIQRRLERFFPEEFGTPGFTSLSGLRWMLRQTGNWLRVYFADVRPSVRARRVQRRDDLISHLLDEGRSTGEILAECLTFAAAGMVTTREFVGVAAWHLFTDSVLLARYRAADEPDRLALLHEILRLEPVIAMLRRRTTSALELPASEQDLGAERGPGPESVRLPPGALVEIHLDSANADPRAVGGAPDRLCPSRATRGAAAPGLSFGDGPHRCPGADIAVLETDIFLIRLFAEPGLRLRTEPHVGFKPSIRSYELRGFTVALGPA
jgi:cytochrome P450